MSYWLTKIALLTCKIL